MSTIKTNTTERTTNNQGENFKDSSSKYGLSKFDYDLYKEEDDVALPVIRAKYFSLPNRGDRWKIFENTKVVFIIEGSKISKKEREFLKTVDGLNFILTQAKAGIKSLNGFRKELKSIIPKKSKATKKIKKNNKS